MFRSYGKHMVLGALAAILAASMVFPAAASTRRRIPSITLKFEADIQPGTDYGDEDIEIEPSGDRFYVDGYTVKNEGAGWDINSVPTLEITLIAADGYYFTKLPADKLRLKGAGAAYVNGSIQDSGNKSVMIVKLDSLQKSPGVMENVQLAADGTASWNKVETAGSYELKVYRNGNAVGSAIETTATSYNCSGKMTRSASYTVKARPINKADPSIKGEWKESDSLYVDGSMADYFREHPVTDPEGAKQFGSWKQAEDGRWWYDNGDGTYPKNCWQQIGEKEYFFDEQGWMKTGWIQWDGKWYYCAEDGGMLKDCMTPDNYWLGEDGAMIQQEPDHQG